MKVNCLSCGHSLDLGDAYDDYSGQVRCYVCGRLLVLRTEEGSVKSEELAPLVRDDASCVADVGP